jgi:hypothetical protein
MAPRSLNRFGFRFRAEGAADPCEPVSVSVDELQRGVTGTEDEKVHATDTTRVSELTDSLPNR